MHKIGLREDYLKDKLNKLIKKKSKHETCIKFYNRDIAECKTELAKIEKEGS